LSIVTPTALAAIWPKIASVPLPLLGHAAQHGHHPGGLEAQRRSVLRGDPGASDAVEGGRRVGDLDHGRQADPSICSFLL
jgi:hypothetical protein